MRYIDKVLNNQIHKRLENIILLAAEVPIG